MKITFATLITSFVGLISALPAPLLEEAALSPRGDSAVDNIILVVFDKNPDGTPQGPYDDEIAAADPGAVLGRRSIEARTVSAADLQSLSERDNDIIAVSFFLAKADAGQAGPYDADVAAADPNAVLGRRSIAARTVSAADLQSLSERDNDIIAVSFFLAKADAGQAGPYDADVAAADPDVVLGRRGDSAVDNIILVVFDKNPDGTPQGPYDDEIAAADPGAVLGKVRLLSSQTSQQTC
jgi:hypothetical protein